MPTEDKMDMWEVLRLTAMAVGVMISFSPIILGGLGIMSLGQDVTIIVAVIGSVGVIVAALIGTYPKLNKILHKLEENQLKTNSDLMVSSKDHSRLSDDHKAMSDTLFYLKEARIREDARNDALATRNFDMDQTIRQLMALHQSIDERDRQIAELKAENVRLNALLNGQSFGRGREQDDEQEL